MKKVHSSLIQKNRESTRFYSFIEITFDQAVTVKESFYKSLSYSELFSSLGGALGLWLGVGIMQIIEHIVKCGSTINIFLNNK